ncbi:hypothetical protein HUT19_20605 [Streptomyces sp. NA02950]|uniref:hypothetical protein n=1 Tax=Streptomyces sp. NA02950 TaxID=2742137 RepID=UPI0015901284|nr:hypothetical protein [Streptomyces sp. NA02950]QKV93865.1 hypothetical protein HUT19_20605 [Streptomyces sp. NA02950]
MASSVARAGADLRMLRAAVFTAVCVVLSAAGHVLASCATVPLWTVGVGAAALFSVVVPLAGRERSLPGIATVLALGQLVLHTVFGLGQQQAAAALRADGQEGRVISLAAHLLCAPVPGRIDAATAHRIVERAGIDPSSVQDVHAAHTMHSAPLSALPGGAHGPGLDGLLPSLPMALGHLLAAVVMGWLLRRGEMAVWRAVGLSVEGAREVAEVALVRGLRAALRLVRALLTGLAGLPSAGPRRPRRAEPDEGATTALVLQHSVIRRGPPRHDLAA